MVTTVLQFYNCQEKFQILALCSLFSKTFQSFVLLERIIFQPGVVNMGHNFGVEKLKTSLMALKS